MSQETVLQKVLRYKELSDQLQGHFNDLETKPMGTILPRIEGTVDELVSVKAMVVNGRVHVRKVAKKAVKATAATVVVASKASSTFDAPGKGRKQCPGCNVYVAARAQTCPKCQHSFGSGETKAPKAPKEDDAVATGKGRRVKGESLNDMLKEILRDAANDGRRKEPYLELPEILEKLGAKGYQTHATEKNLRVAVQARLGEMVKKGEILRAEEGTLRKYSVKPEVAVA